MKRPIATGLGIVALCAGPGMAAEQQMRFLNGDMLVGSLKQLSSERVAWESPLLEEPADFLTDQVYSLMLPTHPPERGESGHEAEITMTNGDVLHGQLAEVSAEYVMLETWFAGRIKLNRRMVESVTVEDIGKLLYRGPSQLEGWTVSSDEDAWVYDSFSLRSTTSGSVARNDVLSDECSLSFEVEWDASNLKLSTVLFSDPIDSDSPRTGYNLSFQGSSVSLRSISPSSYIGNMHLAQIRASNRARIEIRASRLSGKVILLINQKVMAVWQDNDLEKAMLKDGLHFIAEDDSKLRISNIRITEWDGEIDEGMVPAAQMGMRAWRNFMPDQIEPPQNEEEEKDDEPRMKLANGDSIAGKVKSIRDGLVELETALGTIELPVERLRSILLPAAPREEPKRENPDVRCQMSDGGSVVFELISADEKTITGKSQNFGTAVFRRDAFQRIDFNIHMPEFEMMRKLSEDWSE